MEIVHPRCKIRVCVGFEVPKAKERGLEYLMSGGIKHENDRKTGYPVHSKNEVKGYNRFYRQVHRDQYVRVNIILCRKVFRTTSNVLLVRILIHPNVIHIHVYRERDVFEVYIAEVEGHAEIHNEV